MDMLHYKIKSRYYLLATYNFNEIIQLPTQISHHLTKVLRANKLDYLTIFNESFGEWLYQLTEITKNSATIKQITKLKDYTPPATTLQLAYAPLKVAANSFVLEKATELGVNFITNIITNRTVNNVLSANKILSKVIGATEQSGRLDVPIIIKPQKLVTFVSSTTNILWLNEKLHGVELKNYLPSTNLNNITLLIGPEGGFTTDEQTFLNSHANVISVYFKTNILKAETAALASIVTLNNIIKV